MHEDGPKYSGGKESITLNFTVTDITDHYIKISYSIDLKKKWQTKEGNLKSHRYFKCIENQVTNIEITKSFRYSILKRVF